MIKTERIKKFIFKPKDMQLKSIKHHKELSEETYCFSAYLYILDMKICKVSNRGRGGSNDIDFGFNDDFETWEFIQSLERWCLKNLPKWYFEYEDKYVPKSLETWITEQVDDFVNWKDFEKSWKNRVLFVKPAEIGLYEFKAKPTKENLQQLVKENPTYTFLNKMTKQSAFMLYMENTAWLKKL